MSCRNRFDDVRVRATRASGGVDYLCLPCAGKLRVLPASILAAAAALCSIVLLLALPVTAQAQDYRGYSPYRDNVQSSRGYSPYRDRGSYGYTQTSGGYVSNLGTGGATSSADAPLFDMADIIDHVSLSVTNVIGPIIPLIFKIALPIIAIGLVFKIVKTFRESA
jgi:hypothetical protein